MSYKETIIKDYPIAFVIEHSDLSILIGIVDEVNKKNKDYVIKASDKKRFNSDYEKQHFVQVNSKEPTWIIESFNGSIVDTVNSNDVVNFENTAKRRIQSIGCSINSSYGINLDLGLNSQPLGFTGNKSFSYKISGNPEDIYNIALKLDNFAGEIRQWYSFLFYKNIGFWNFLGGIIFISLLAWTHYELNDRNNLVNVYIIGRDIITEEAIDQIKSAISSNYETKSEFGLLWLVLPVTLLIIFFFGYLSFPRGIFSIGGGAKIARKYDNRRNFFFIAIILAISVNVFSSVIYEYASNFMQNLHK